MKVKKIVAIVMGTALVGSVAAGVSACKKSGGSYGALGTTTLNLADYAVEYEGASYLSKKGYVSAKELVNGAEYSSGNYVTVENNGKYSVYNLDTEKYILSNKDSRPWSNYIGSLRVYVVSDTDGDGSAFYADDGTEILASGVYTDLQSERFSVFVGGETEKSYVYRVYGNKTVGSGTANEETEEIEVYIKEVTDKETGDVTGYTKISKADIKTYDPEYAVGTTHIGVNKVYTSTMECPVEGKAANYSYMQLGSRYTFYDGTDKEGTVDVPVNGEVLGFVGNYLYYYTLEPVISDSKDYNVVTQIISSSSYSGVSTLEYKFDYSLYKYDFTKDKLTELNCDAMVTALEPIYNYKTKSYDTAFIGGQKMTDGVAISLMTTSSGDVGYIDQFTYFVNSDLKVGYDTTGIFSEAPWVFSLGDDKFLIGGRYDSYANIVDGKFNVLMSGIESVYMNEGLVAISCNGYYGFTNLEGKMVIAPEYTSSSTPVFYNGVALMHGTDGDVLLKKDGTVIAKISDMEKSNMANVTKRVETHAGYYKLITTTTSGSGENVTVNYVAFDGTLLKSFAHNDLTEFNVNGSVCIREKITKGITTTYTYYKIV